MDTARAFYAHPPLPGGLDRAEASAAVHADKNNKAGPSSSKGKAAAAEAEEDDEMAADDEEDVDDGDPFAPASADGDEDLPQRVPTAAARANCGACHGGHKKHTCGKDTKHRGPYGEFPCPRGCGKICKRPNSLSVHVASCSYVKGDSEEEEEEEQFEDDAESGMRLQLSKKNPSGYMGILKKPSGRFQAMARIGIPVVRTYMGMHDSARERRSHAQGNQQRRRRPAAGR